MIKIESTAVTVAQAFERRMAARAKQAREQLLDAAEEFVDDVKREQFSGRSGRRYLNRVTGRAKNGWRIKATTSGGELRIKISNNVPYVAIHEEETQRLRLRRAFSEFAKTARAILRRTLGSA